MKSFEEVSQKTFRIMRQAKRYIAEIDFAMTELKKVSEITDSRISGFFENAAAQAQEYGATLTDVINLTADRSRPNYNLSQNGGA